MVNATGRIELAGEDGKLLLTPGENGWTQVVLQQGEVTLALGAETLKQIVSRLRTFLGQTGVGTKWVLGLSELHFSIYGEQVETKAILKIQDADAKFVTTLIVGPEQRTAWLDALARV